MKNHIPECLSKLYETVIALDEADVMLAALKKVPGNTVDSQIQFLEAQIKDLETHQKELQEEAEAVIEPIRRKENKTYLAIRLHFFCGLSWLVVSEYLGSTDSIDAIKSAVYRKFRK